MNQDRVVMVLDDEPGVTRMCRTALEQAGYEVLESRDARKAVSVLESARVDLLLVDIQMPHMDGFQVMEKARAHQPDIAILIMTGYGTMETATKALRMGASGLILKPFESNDELIGEVRKALDERDTRRESSRLQALQPLLQVTDDLFKSRDQGKLIDLILDAITDLLASPHAGYYRREEESEDQYVLELAAQRGNPLPGEPVGFTGGPVAYADAWGTPYRVSPGVIEQEEHYGMIAEHGLGAVLCAPAVRGTDANIVLLACGCGAV
jgi:CheY-like chemotaxis protein